MLDLTNKKLKPLNPLILLRCSDFLNFITYDIELIIYVTDVDNALSHKT